MAKKPIGEANIRIKVEGADKVKSDLDGIKTQAEQVGESGRQGFGRLDDAVGKAGQSIEDSTAGLRKFQGALSGIFGVVTGLAGTFALAFTAIVSDIKKAEDKLRDLRKGVEEARDAARDASSGFDLLADSINTSLVDDDIQRALEENTDDIQKYRKAIDEEVRKIDVALSDLRFAGKGSSGEAALLEEERQRLIESGERLIRAIEKQGLDRVKAIRDAQEKSAREEEERIRQQKEREQERILKEQESEQRSAQAEAARELARTLRELESRVEDQVKAMNENTRTQQQMLRQLVIFLPDIRRVGDGVAGN